MWITGDLSSVAGAVSYEVSSCLTKRSLSCGCRAHSCVAGVQSGMKCGALMNRSLNFEDVDLCLRVTQSGWEV